MYWRAINRNDYRYTIAPVGQPTVAASNHTAAPPVPEKYASSGLDASEKQVLTKDPSPL